VAPRQRDSLKMFFTLKGKRGLVENWAGPPLFVGESLNIGQTATRYPRGEWVQVTVYAPGHRPRGPIFDQGEASLIRSLAAEKRGPEPATTDVYCQVECVGNHKKPQHRGTPTWDGDQLEIDGNVYPPGEWSKVTVFSEGWAARQQPPGKVRRGGTPRRPPEPEPDPASSP
jgi:hypothetical protein